MNNLQFHIAVAGFEFQVFELRGHEALSRLWRMEASFGLKSNVMVGAPDAFEPDVVIKRDAVITLRQDVTPTDPGLVVRSMRGIVTEADLSAAVNGVPRVDLVVEPRFSLLRHRSDVRTHRNLTVPQIVTEVAAGLGVKVETRLGGSYDTRPYCVQWRESDFDYCMRLLEDEGIFYFFSADDVLVLGDSPSAYDAVPGNALMIHKPVAGLITAIDVVYEFGSSAKMVPGKVTLRDWNTEHPSLDMDVSSGTGMPFAPEWYDYPGEYEEPAEGVRKARLHAEAFDRASARHEGQTTCPRMYPGSTFTMAAATPGVASNEYVVRALSYEWNLEHKQTFHSAFEADDADLTYRPPRDTFVPRIFNPLTGIVCTNGDDIQCDHFGRVKVRQHWDRLRPFDDDCSHWVPVLQDNTGGSSAIPRKDWEVMVHFMEGDPDRPIVLGRVYNGEDTVQEVLPEAKYRTNLRSLTTPTRDSSNQIQFQDLSGSEEVFVHACKDQNIRVANDQTKSTGLNEEQGVQHDETITVGGDCKWKIGNDFLPSVVNDQKWTVESGRKIGIGSACTSAVGNDHELTITGDHKRDIMSDDDVSTKNLTENIEGALKEKFDTLHNSEFKNLELKVKAAFTERIKAEKSETTTTKRIDKVMKDHTLKVKGVCQARCDDVRKVFVKKDMMATVLNTTNLTGAEGFEGYCKEGFFRGGFDVLMRVGETEIALKEGIVRLSAPKGSVYFTIAGKADHAAVHSSQN